MASESDAGAPARPHADPYVESLSAISVGIEQSQFVLPQTWDSVDDIESRVSSGDPTRRTLDLVITKSRGSAAAPFVSNVPTSPIFEASFVAESSSGNDRVSEGGSEAVAFGQLSFVGGSVETSGRNTDSSTGDGQRDSSGGSSSSSGFVPDV